MIKPIEFMKNDVIKFTQDLIRVPSPVGEEEKLAKVVFDKLQEFSLDDVFIDGIGNVVGVLRGEGRGPDILLNTHMDTVPPGDINNWNGYDPFGAEIDQEGYIHGLAAADDKGGLSVQLYLMKLLKDLKDQGASIPGNLIFSTVVQEEAVGMFGIEYLCQKTLPDKKLDVDVVFLGEPTDLNLLIGHRGKVEIVVTVKGRAAHSSAPWLGINALEMSVPLLDKIFKEWRTNIPENHAIGKRSMTITNLICRPGTLSIIPDECEISVDRRYLPGESLESILSEFEQMIMEIKDSNPQFEASVRIRSNVATSYTGYSKEVQKHHNVWMLEKDNSFLKKATIALQRVGQNPKIGYWPGGTDGSMTAGRLKIPTIGYSGMQIEFAHTSKEMVSIEMLMRSLEGYFSIICELFGIYKDGFEDSLKTS